MLGSISSMTGSMTRVDEMKGRLMFTYSLSRCSDGQQHEYFLKMEVRCSPAAGSCCIVRTHEMPPRPASTLTELVHLYVLGTVKADGEAKRYEDGSWSQNDEKHRIEQPMPAL
jgi:hypothetical protein